MSQAGPLTISSSIGGAPVGVTKDNLNWLPLGQGGGTNGVVTFSFSQDAGVVTGAASGLYAAPFLSHGNGAAFGDANGADASRYITTSSAAAFGGANATMTFAQTQTYFGLLWGSVDSYNWLDFYRGSTLIGRVNGGDVAALANGDQGEMGTYYVNILSDTAFDRVVAASNGYAFEFDNISYSPSAPSVPEPATLCLLGLGVLEAARRLRKR